MTYFMKIKKVTNKPLGKSLLLPEKTLWGGWDIKLINKYINLFFPVSNYCVIGHMV